MADQGAQDGGQGSIAASVISSVTFLFETGSGDALPRSKNVVLVDRAAPQSLDLVVPNLHYGSRSPIRGVSDFVQHVAGTAENANPSAPVATPIAEGAEAESAAVALDLGKNAPSFIPDA